MEIKDGPKIVSMSQYKEALAAAQTQVTPQVSKKVQAGDWRDNFQGIRQENLSNVSRPKAFGKHLPVDPDPGDEGDHNPGA